MFLFQLPSKILDLQLSLMSGKRIAEATTSLLRNQTSNSVSGVTSLEASSSLAIAKLLPSIAPSLHHDEAKIVAATVLMIQQQAERNTKNQFIELVRNSWSSCIARGDPLAFERCLEILSPSV